TLRRHARIPSHGEAQEPCSRRPWSARWTRCCWCRVESHAREAHSRAAQRRCQEGSKSTLGYSEEEELVARASRQLAACAPGRALPHTLAAAPAPRTTQFP